MSVIVQEIGGRNTGERSHFRLFDIQIQLEDENTNSYWVSPKQDMTWS